MTGLMAALLVGLLACGSQQPVQTSPGATAVNVTLTADKAVYARDEPIQVTLEVVNHSAQPVTLRFPTAQRYDAVVHAVDGRQVWRWSSDQVFAQMLGEETLAAAGGQRTYHVAVREPLSPGHYIVVGSIPTMGTRLSASTEIDIR
jgi:hypothetical protein